VGLGVGVIAIDRGPNATIAAATSPKLPNFPARFIGLPFHSKERFSQPLLPLAHL
jgi:hypothetical protein